MVKVSFLGSVSSLFEYFSCYWSSDMEYISDSISNIPISLHNFNYKDVNMQLIFVPKTNAYIKSISYMSGNQHKKIKNLKIPLSWNSEIFIYHIEIIIPHTNYELHGINANYVSLIPQFVYDSYIQAISNFVFFDNLRRRQTETFAIDQLKNTLVQLNDYYNRVFDNIDIDSIYNRWLNCKDKILSNINIIEHDRQFIFDGYYTTDNINYKILYNNDINNLVNDIRITFKKKTNSQLEMTLSFEKKVDDGWYSIILFDNNTNLYIDTYWLYICNFSESDWLSLVQAKKEIVEYNELIDTERDNFGFEWSYGITNYSESYYYNIFSNSQFLGLSQYINSVTNVETRKKIN